MIISILIPTRKRVKLLEASIRSLVEKANNPANIEIMVAYDCDDEESKQYFKSTRWNDLLTLLATTGQAFETPTWGYSSLHTYYNYLAKKSKGDWLLIWNDDALMQSDGWDDHVVDNQNFVGMLHMITENYRAKFALFPLIPRVWLDLFGYVGEIPVDSWIHHICMEAQAIQRIEPLVYHDRYDMSGRNCDETYLNRDPSTIKKNYKSEESKAVRHQWAQKLIDYRKSLGL